MYHVQTWVTFCSLQGVQPLEDLGTGLREFKCKWNLWGGEKGMDGFLRVAQKGHPPSPSTVRVHFLLIWMAVASLSEPLQDICALDSESPFQFSCKGVRGMLVWTRPAVQLLEPLVCYILASEGGTEFGATEAQTSPSGWRCQNSLPVLKAPIPFNPGIYPPAKV